MSMITKEKLQDLGLSDLDIDNFVVKDAPLQKSGILVIDKPKGISSMDVVRLLRRLCRPKKIGHGGSLDPSATGVLPVLLNSATKWSNEVMQGVKEYEGSFLLGVRSDTQDTSGKQERVDFSFEEPLSLKKIQEEAEKFVGKILQRPPLYSAIKKNGRPLYDYARSGESVEVSEREVVVESFEMTSWDGQSRVEFRAKVHKGVYVRTLVHDLGERLGCGAVLDELVRTQVGHFRIEEALRLSTLKFASDVEKSLKPVTRI